MKDTLKLFCAWLRSDIYAAITLQTSQKGLNSDTPKHHQFGVCPFSVAYEKVALMSKTKCVLTSGEKERHSCHGQDKKRFPTDFQLCPPLKCSKYLRRS